MLHARSLLAASLLLATACAKQTDLDQIAPSATTAQDAQTTLLTDQLVKPIGLSVDNRNRVWVSQSGTGQNDASVAVVTPNGDVQTAFVGFGSAVLPNGELGALNHVLYRDGVLYILDGLNGRLYLADVSGYKNHDAPVAASTLPYISIKPFVLSQNLSTPLDSNLYDLTFGPDGHLYIADAGANAIIKVNLATQALSVFARIANITPPSAPNQIQPVPTGIIYDGSKFLVTTLTGFPFLAGAAKILQISTSGVVSDYRTGFTALTNLAPAGNGGLLVTEYGRFVFNPPTTVGWQPSTGRVATDAGVTVAGGQDRITDIERLNPQFYYVLSNGAGTIQKLKY
ncbi:ScyD/ScyE family protein [Hymenobacter sp. 15J16-1T3B]|uniref:ScyD/ScyE family protein n=1 Tax=Hymenobacter sp. 15J16-1T3B TaxID=2886941 RepID=UPI001D11869C|nr:ScyD/ScyE family protein [Hymenobacter sp. 15J16-1T3B]MCC3156218.1 ScyD/ScyE family protein [Hymenobacter sp. 15J16-1T3B]